MSDSKSYYVTPGTPEHLAKITARIEALILKAENGATPEEAELLLAKAEELMLKYAITLAKRERDGKVEKEGFVSVRIPFTAAKHFWKALGVFGANAVVEAIGLCKMSVYMKTQQCSIHGTKADVEYTIKIVESVWRQANEHFKMWKKLDATYQSFSRETAAGRKLRYDSEQNYLLGFAHGFAARIEETRTAVETATTGAELVLVNRRAEIEEYVGKLGKNRSQSLNFAPTGYSQGKAAGHAASLGNEVAK